MRPLSIGLAGTRGIPARYGGFETFAEELSVRLAARGHRVTVYVRQHYACHPEAFYRGVELQVLPAVRTKYLETVTHTFFSLLHAFWKRFDVLLICNGVNAWVAWLPRLRGTRTVLNVDGIERRRRKWGAPGRWFYAVNERLATLTPTRVVTDAQVIHDYYLSRYGLATECIPYGAPIGREDSQDAVICRGLQAQQYFLYVSRLEPENNAHLVIEAYRASGVSEPLVVVGDAPYSDQYKRHLRRLAEGLSVRFPGAVYGREYRELLSHCRCYLHATEVGGTHPALLEAMGAGVPIIAHDTPENREVVEGCGILCDFRDREQPAAWMRRAAAGTEIWSDLVLRAQERIRSVYDWERITNRYEELFYDLVG